MTERRPASTIGELDIHLSNLQSRIVELSLALQTMANNTATKSDIEGIRLSMATLATKSEVAAEINAIRAEVERNKPSTLLRNFAALLAAIALLGSVAAMVIAVGDFMARVPPKPTHYQQPPYQPQQQSEPHK